MPSLPRSFEQIIHPQSRAPTSAQQILSAGQRTAQTIARQHPIQAVINRAASNFRATNAQIATGRTRAGNRIRYNVAPLSGTGTSILGGVQKGYGWLANEIATFFTPKKFATRAAMASATYVGSKLIKSGITGDPLQAPTPRELKILGGYVVGGIPGVAFGLAESPAPLIRKGYGNVKDILGIQNVSPSGLFSPTVNIPTGTLPNTPSFPEFPQVQLPETNFAPSYAAPSAGFSPSFSVGGGGVGMGEVALLALAAGAGGFLLGRKKYKRKRRKKKHGRRSKR